MIGGSAMAFSPSFVGRGRQSCPTRKHRAHPSLDTTQNRAVAFHPATGTSWLEVNPAAVRTDGGPGSRFQSPTIDSAVSRRAFASALLLRTITVVGYARHNSANM